VESRRARLGLPSLLPWSVRRTHTTPPASSSQPWCAGLLLLSVLGTWLTVHVADHSLHPSRGPGEVTWPEASTLHLTVTTCVQEGLDLDLQ
jgi:hypothetical protein